MKAQRPLSRTPYLTKRRRNWNGRGYWSHNPLQLLNLLFDRIHWSHDSLLFAAIYFTALDASALPTANSTGYKDFRRKREAIKPENIIPVMLGPSL
jgi:hypothetical protein